MDLFLTIVIAGMATGGAIAFLSLIIGRWLPDSILKTILTLPFSLTANGLLGLLDYHLVVATFASGFFALVVLSVTSRPVVVDSLRRR
jgi:ABC-type bacteriocin/lantibiotic exporter with double-glycine peptidase domain